MSPTFFNPDGTFKSPNHPCDRCGCPSDEHEPGFVDDTCNDPFGAVAERFGPWDDEEEETL